MRQPSFTSVLNTLPSAPLGVRTLILGSAFGLLACYYVRPFVGVYRAHNAFFRKAWMTAPLYLSTFAFAFHCSVQLPMRVFPKILDRKRYLEGESMDFG